MIKAFESFEEFKEGYKFYISESGGGIYLHTMYTYPKQSFWEKIFHVKRWLEIYEKDNCDENGYCGTSYGLYLARVINVTCLCHVIEEVDIDWLDYRGELRSNRVKVDELYHYEMGEYGKKCIKSLKTK